MRAAGFLLTAVIVSGCSGQPPPPPAGNQSAPLTRPAPYVGKIWVSTDPSAAPGTFRIFLPDGALVMDSCIEVYRLARWRAIDDRRIEWTEDTARIEADIAEITAERMQLRLKLTGGIREENYRLAQIPFLCQEVRR
jgi:hypothetical protein